MARYQVGLITLDDPGISEIDDCIYDVEDKEHNGPIWDLIADYCDEEEIEGMDLEEAYEYALKKKEESDFESAQERHSEQMADYREYRNSLDEGFIP